MDDTDRERHLSKLDKLAETIVTRAAPVRFSVVTTPGELEAVWRLRATVVLERGWRQPHELSGGVERDEYDDWAVHIAGWDGETLAATARIVFPVPGVRLPTEAHFNVTALPDGPVANLDRIIVAREYSELNHHVLMALVCRSWLELRSHYFHLWIGAVTPGIVRLYRRLGWRVVPVGPSRLHWGEERLPCLFDPFEAFVPPPNEDDGTLNGHIFLLERTSVSNLE